MRLVLFVTEPSGSWDIQRRQFRLSGRAAAHARAHLGEDVLVCEQNGQALNYFGIARIEGLTAPGPDVSEHTLKIANLAYFMRAIRVENAAGSMVLRADGLGRERGDDPLGWIPDAEFVRLTQAGGLPPNATEAQAMLETGFAEQQQALWQGSYSSVLAFAPNDSLEARALAAYGWRCAATDIKIFNRLGNRCEAIAVPIRHGEKDRAPAAVKDMICLSRTWAYLYETGLMAIAGDYSILVKDALVPDIVLAQLRESGEIALPANAEDWPDPDALAAHCGLHFS